MPFSEALRLHDQGASVARCVCGALSRQRVTAATELEFSFSDTGEALSEQLFI